MGVITLQSFLIVSLILFLTGLYTIVSRKNIIGILMGIELILNSSALNFASFSRFSGGGLEGQVFSIFIIVLAAAEAAVALALLLAVFRRQRDIDADRLNILKG